MSKRTLIVFATVFSLGAVFSILVLAQSPANPPDLTPDLQSTAMDNQGVKRYRVGPGDLLDVRVFGQADLNSTVEIDEDGNISSLPFLEDPIPAKCRNEKDIQKSITQAYAKYIVKPRVSVRILERRSRPPAVIFGAVRAPQRVQMMRRVRLHELLAVAGGISGGASGTIQVMHTERELCPEPGDLPQQVTATAPPTPKTTTVPNGTTVASAASAPNTSSPNPAGVQDPTGSDRAAFADIGQLEIYKIDTLKAGGFAVSGGGTGSSDPYIRPGDIVIVTEGLPIYITGAVVSPREVVWKDEITLARALAMAGGVQKLAKSSEVHVYRQRKGQIGQDDLKFNYDAIKKGTEKDVVLQAYDIIDVRMQSIFSPKSLGDFFMNMGKGSLGILPQRVVY